MMPESDAPARTGQPSSSLARRTQASHTLSSLFPIARSEPGSSIMNSSSQRLALPLRWLARFTGLLSMGVLLLFMTGEDGLLSPQAWAKVRPADWVLIFFFPFGILVGLALAWWREALGAVVAAGSLAAFYVSEAVLFGRLPGGPWF